MFLLAWILGCSDEGGDSTAADSDADTDADSDTDTDTDSDTDADTDTDADPITEDDEAVILATAEAELAAAEATGAQIAVWYDGRVAYHWEIGTVGTSGEPIQQDTLFQIGSDTKKLTAIALLQQEDAGLLSRNDVLNSRVEGYEVAQDPSWSGAVTFHHLLSQQGECFDYIPWDAAPDDDDLSARAALFAGKYWIYAPPGSYWSYSNPNFSFPALAIEEVTGRPFADVLQEDVLDALGLTNSFARLTDVAKYGNMANGHGYNDSWEYGEVELEEFIDNAWTRPAGLVWSTATDMAKLGGFLLEGDAAVLSEEAREAIISPQVRLYPAFENATYGYGTFHDDGFVLGEHGALHDDGFPSGDDFYDTVLVSHGGHTMSMTSHWFLLPSGGAAISILTNGYFDDFGATAIEIIERLDVLPAPTKVPPDYLPTTETDHTLLTGTYLDPALGEIEVWDDAGTLQIAIPGIGAYGYMTFYLEDLYLASVGSSLYDFKFVRDGFGTYRWIVNRSIQGTRVEELRSTRRVVPSGREEWIRREMTLHEARFRPRPGMPPAPTVE